MCNTLPELPYRILAVATAGFFPCLHSLCMHSHETAIEDA